jgi:hypothetical protein
MDREFADAVIDFTLWCDPERVAEVIAEVAGQLEAKGYSAQEIAAAIDELLDELNGDRLPRKGGTSLSSRSVSLSLAARE